MSCRQCGKAAPPRVLRAQKEAAARNASSPAPKPTYAAKAEATPPQSELDKLRRQNAKLAEEVASLCKAPAEQASAELPAADPAAAIDADVARLEGDLRCLKTLSYPGVQFQVADLERHIASLRGSAHQCWPPARVKRRLQVRADEAQQEAAKAQAALDAANQQLE